MSIILRTLGFPSDAIQRFLWRRFKWNRCELEGDTIVLYKTRSNFRKIQAQAIESWSAYPEMCFDVVQIVLENGETVTWFDKYDDLLDALRKIAEGKEILSEKSEGA